MFVTYLDILYTIDVPFWTDKNCNYSNLFFYQLRVCPTHVCISTILTHNILKCT